MNFTGSTLNYAPTDPEIPNQARILWDGVTIEFILKFLVAYFFLVWIALIIWVARDISIRTTSRIYQLFCILLMLFGTPLAIFIYLLLRPRKNLIERYYEEVEGNLDILHHIVEGHIQDLLPDTGLRCPKCERKVEEDYIVCPSCETQLKTKCEKCHQSIRVGWKVCPYCEVMKSETT